MFDLFNKNKVQLAEAKNTELEEKLNKLIEEGEKRDKIAEDARLAEIAEQDAEDELQAKIAESDKVKNAHKTLATERGEPWVNIIDIDFDSETLQQGSVELDWNQIFVDKLRENGFQGAKDEAVVDQWFENFCRHIMANTYQQAHSDLGEPNSEKLDNGRVEYK